MLHSNQRKTTFRTTWGTYAYTKIPFGLINDGTTFQREIKITFLGLINKVVVVYLNDVMVYSKKRHEHLMHLKHIFDCWRKYGIALNLKKSVLMAIEDKLLGFVVLKDGINIELEIMEAIKKLTHLCSKNMMPPFLENISLLRHFVPSFVEIVKLLQDMIKKNSKFKWGPKEKESFS